MGFAEGADADDGLLRACDYDVARVIDRLVGGGAGAAGGAPPAPQPAAAAAAGAEGEVGMLQQALEERAQHCTASLCSSAQELPLILSCPATSFAYPGNAVFNMSTVSVAWGDAQVLQRAR